MKPGILIQLTLILFVRGLLQPFYCLTDPIFSEPTMPERRITYKEVVTGDIAEGNIVTFGLYEQDGDLDNGAEPIEWHVLKVDDGRATLYPVYGMIACSRDNIDETLADFASTFTSDENSVMISGPSLFTNSEYYSFTYGEGSMGRQIDPMFLCKPTKYCKAAYSPRIGYYTESNVYAYYTGSGGMFHYQDEYDHNAAGSCGHDVAFIHDSQYKKGNWMMCPYIIINVEN